MNAVQAAESLFWELDSALERLQKPRALRDRLEYDDPLRIVIEDTEIMPLVDAAMALLEAMVAQSAVFQQVSNARRANYLSYFDERRAAMNCTDQRNRERR